MTQKITTVDNIDNAKPIDVAKHVQKYADDELHIGWFDTPEQVYIEKPLGFRDTIGEVIDALKAHGYELTHINPCQELSYRDGNPICDIIVFENLEDEE